MIANIKQYIDFIYNKALQSLAAFNHACQPAPVPVRIRNNKKRVR